MSLFFETKRSELPDYMFGVPELRKFPLDSEKHVKSAIKFFNYVDDEHEKELAKAIIKNMEKYNIDESEVGPKNRLRKYLSESFTDDLLIEGGFRLTFRIYPILLKAVFMQKGRYDFEYLKTEHLPKIVKKCKDRSDIDYLKTDLGYARTQFEALKRNVQYCEKNDEKNMKRVGLSLKRAVRNGKVSSKKIDDYIRFLNTDYKKMLNDRLKEVEKK